MSAEPTTRWVAKRERKPLPPLNLTDKQARVLRQVHAGSVVQVQRGSGGTWWLLTGVHSRSGGETISGRSMRVMSRRGWFSAKDALLTGTATLTDEGKRVAKEFVNRRRQRREDALLAEDARRTEIEARREDRARTAHARSLARIQKKLLRRNGKPVD